MTPPESSVEPGGETEHPSNDASADRVTAKASDGKTP